MNEKHKVTYWDVEDIPVILTETEDDIPVSVTAYGIDGPRPFRFYSVCKNGHRITKEEFNKLVEKEIERDRLHRALAIERNKKKKQPTDT